MLTVSALFKLIAVSIERESVKAVLVGRAEADMLWVLL